MKKIASFKRTSDYRDHGMVVGWHVFNLTSKEVSQYSALSLNTILAIYASKGYKYFEVVGNNVMVKAGDGWD